jgi:hypothetical protein
MPAWLDQVNQLRALANLPSVTENPDYSQAATAMCQYECETLSVPSHLDGDTNSQYYTAAQSSNLFGSATANVPDSDIINAWGYSVFHGIGIIDPHLKQVGYGYYTTAGATLGGLKTVAALNLIQGLDWNTPVSYPIMWPANGNTIQVNTYSPEIPDARTFCQYLQAGTPIILQLGYGTQINSVQATVTWVEHTSFTPCVIDATNYTYSDPAWQSVGRQILNARGAVVLLLSEPLFNDQYMVDMVVNGQSYNWRFNVAAPTPPIDLSYIGPNMVIAGQSVQGQWSASGGAAPYTFACQFEIPEGLFLSPDGTLSGRAKAFGAGGYVLLGQVTATDSVGSQGTARWSLGVNSAPIVVSPFQLPDAVQGQPYSAQLTATDGYGTYTFPTLGIGAGLSLNAAGLVSGTPTSGGFHIQLSGQVVTDSYGSQAQFGFDIHFLASQSSIPARPAR